MSEVGGDIPQASDKHCFDPLTNRLPWVHVAAAGSVLCYGDTPCHITLTSPRRITPLTSLALFLSASPFPRRVRGQTSHAHHSSLLRVYPQCCPAPCSYNIKPLPYVTKPVSQSPFTFHLPYSFLLGLYRLSVCYVCLSL